ncbi:hypothetical protein [Jhaorihella thermophila]|uniref:hypothetical protein n=1 Tax=Jhaorihella thermophila TaxID=488547 RepID=UPI0011B065A4|nr:hypothetical protein [Jhaorihella thermophila]
MAAFLWVSVAGTATAGAWLQQPGRAFLAVSATGYARPGRADMMSSLYAEYGLLPRLTVGLDVNGHAAIASGSSAHALLFARLPLSAPDRSLRAAAELALGAYHANHRSRPMLRLKASLGSGFSSLAGPGWLNLGAEYERIRADRAAYKLNAAIGLSDGPTIRPLLEIETWKRRDTPLIWTVTLSAMWDRGPATTWLIGLRRRSPDAALGVRLALWRRF